MATPRAIRIPRAAQRPTIPPGPAPAVVTPIPGGPAIDRRRNQAGTERAYRLTLIYVGTLVVLYAVFVALDRSAPGGTSAAVETGILYFSVIAAALGIGGAIVALSPAPRAIELYPDALVVIEWWGHRRRFPPLEGLHRSVIRRFPPSFLSSRAVEVTEIGTPAGGRRTYQLEAGLLPDPGSIPPARER